MTRRRKVMKIHGCFVPDMLRGVQDGYGCTTKDIPDDLSIVGAEYDPFRGELSLLVESETFEETLEGNAYPSFNPTYKRVRL